MASEHTMIQIGCTILKTSGLLPEQGYKIMYSNPNKKAQRTDSNSMENSNTHKVSLSINTASGICLLLTCSAVGLASASFWRQASINEQNSAENMCFSGDGDGSSSICHEETGIVSCNAKHKNAMQIEVTN